jgi:hypothetical protein
MVMQAARKFMAARSEFIYSSQESIMKRNVLSRFFTSLLCAAAVTGTTLGSQASAEPSTGYIPYIPPVIIIPIFLKPIMAQCTISAAATETQWFVTRDVRLNGYLGWSADSVKFRYQALTSGTYKFRIVIRDTDRYGDLITRSEVRSVALTAGTPTNVSTYFSNVYVGNALNLSISHEEVTGPGTLYFLQTSASSCTGTSLSETDGTMPGPAADIGFELRGENTHAVTEVIEYNMPALNKYFITGRDAEKAALDALPTIFTRTGKKFKVPSKLVYGNVFDVYRFFSPEPGTRSHAYVDKIDHDLILSIPNTGLVDEGADFGSVKPDISGACPSWAPLKVYRSFHNTPVVGDRSHRYTTSLTDYNAMTTMGWSPEGIVFCAYSN